MTTSILVVDPDKEVTLTIRGLLKPQGLNVRGVANGYKALGLVGDEANSFSLVMVDLELPLMERFELIEKLRTLAPDVDVAVMTARGTIPEAVQAMRYGAAGYLTKPLLATEVLLTVEHILETKALKEQNAHLLSPASKAVGSFIGQSEPVLKLRKLVRKVAPTAATVLITGESGSGKEVIARMVHDESPRAERPFVAVNCSALSDSLLESELFGHEKGAFTGAHATRKGRFEQAQGGTIFLDELGEMAMGTQVKLLRVLQERQLERVGSSKSIPIDVRIVAATNRDLKARIKEGSFREDLYFRLNVVHISVPPLRDRKSDIPLLAQHFLNRFSTLYGRPVEQFTTRCAAALKGYHWPGNVRELQNVVERALIVAEGFHVDTEDLPEEVQGYAPPRKRVTPGGVTVPGATLAAVERETILKTLEFHGGSTKKTAATLGISVRKVRYKLAEYRQGADKRAEGAH